MANKKYTPFLHLNPDMFQTPATATIGDVYASRFGKQLSEISVGQGSYVFRSDSQGIWLGASEFASAPFRVNMLGQGVFNSITITGYIPTGGAADDVTDNDGDIAGGSVGAWNINSVAMYSDSGGTGTGVYITSADSGRLEAGSSTHRAGITGNGAASTSIVIWAGGLYADRDTAPFRVTRAGAVTASNLTITGGAAGGTTITSTTLTGGIFRTASSGYRMQMDTTSAPLKFWDGTTSIFWGDTSGNMNIRGSFVIYSGGSGIGAMGNVGGDVVLSSLTGTDLLVTSANTLSLQTGSVIPSTMIFYYGSTQISHLDSNGFKVINGAKLYAYSAGNDKQAIFYHNDSDLFIQSTSGDIVLHPAGLNIRPNTDNNTDLGSLGIRFDDVYATNGTIQTSDLRMKDNVKNSDLGLSFLLGLRPISYTWKGEGKRTHYGFGAQEVEKLLNGKDFAGLVYNKDVNRYGMRQTELIAPTVKAIQEMYNQFDERLKKLEIQVGGLHNGH